MDESSVIAHQTQKGMYLHFRNGPGIFLDCLNLLLLYFQEAPADAIAQVLCLLLWRSG